jgi:hypothetical protein
MRNSLNQSQSVNEANRKALRQAVKHRAKVKLVRSIAKPASVATRRGR